MTQSPRARGKVLCAMPRGHMRPYVRGGCINFRDGCIDWKLKVLVTFLRVIKSDRRVSTPTSFPPDIPNLETAIVFKIVQIQITIN